MFEKQRFLNLKRKKVQNRQSKAIRYPGMVLAIPPIRYARYGVIGSLENGLNRERRTHAPERFTRFGTKPASVCSVCIHGTVLVVQPMMGKFETVWWPARLTFSLRYEAVWFRGLRLIVSQRFDAVCFVVFFSFGPIRFARYGLCAVLVSGLNRGVAFLTPKRFERYAMSLQLSKFVSFEGDSRFTLPILVVALVEELSMYQF